jgi:hypothetical protein
MQCQDNDINSNMTLYCDGTGTIEKILFAGYGQPSGTCGEWQHTACDYGAGIKAQVEKLCIGKSRCHIDVARDLFPKGEPAAPQGCQKAQLPWWRHLAVQMVCNPVQNYNYVSRVYGWQRASGRAVCRPDAAL